MRLVFMGTPDFSVAALDALVEAGHEICAVYAQPPRPAGRGKKLRSTPVQERAGGCAYSSRDYGWRRGDRNLHHADGGRAGYRAGLDAICHPD